MRHGRRYGTGMSDPWNYAGPVTQLGSGTGSVTLVDESTFAISGSAGDIAPGAAQGLFFRDTRIVSRFEVLIDGSPAEPLAAVTDDPFSATFVSRNHPEPGRADSTLMIFRSRHVGQGMRDELTLRNFSDEATACTVDVLVDAEGYQAGYVPPGLDGLEEGRDGLHAGVEYLAYVGVVAEAERRLHRRERYVLGDPNRLLVHGL